MKKKYSLALALLMMVLINCSKDSSDGNIEETGGQLDKSANLMTTGDSANDLLSNSHYDRLLLEIAYVEGFRPIARTESDVLEFIREVTFKQNIEVTYNSLPSPGEETLTIAEIDDLETQNRTLFNTDDAVAIYIYFADAPFEGDDPDSDLVTLGAVYRNTSMVIYASSAQKLAATSSLITSATIETATMQHEFGHLLGLVNLGTDMVNAHESNETDENGDAVTGTNGEPSGNSHCNVDGCLMSAELEFTLGMKRMLTAKNGAVPVLDAECLRDLRANGGR
tara:strand:- start:169464 stop:170306 length:843 start_codon:yes stop_codon:yes gene_type:complete